jgi:L,D-peptidoglycan transpeptidase YkuD (ErfK/YbiS/YcfS/YnhG family)
MSKLRYLVVVAAAIISGPAFAQSCPPPLDTALRLILVTTSDMTGAKARVQLFERKAVGAPWRPVSAGEPVMVGTNGLAWGLSFLSYKRDDEPEKIEGDKRTPAGFFNLGPSFGFTATKLPGHIKVEKGQTVCVEDPTSSRYNTITTRAELEPGTKADNMSDTSLFRNGLLVQYPTDRQSKRGSCIFIHVWKTPDTRTSGCVALPEPRVKALQEFAQKGAVLGVVPETARDRFPGCLPAASPHSQ